MTRKTVNLLFWGCGFHLSSGYGGVEKRFDSDRDRHCSSKNWHLFLPRLCHLLPLPCSASSQHQPPCQSSSRNLLLFLSTSPFTSLSHTAWFQRSHKEYNLILFYLVDKCAQTQGRDKEREELKGYTETLWYWIWVLRLQLYVLSFKKWSVWVHKCVGVCIYVCVCELWCHIFQIKVFGVMASLQSCQRFFVCVSQHLYIGVDCCPYILVRWIKENTNQGVFLLLGIWIVLIPF